MGELPNIDLLELGLQRVDSIMGAAESHGALCGILCARGSANLSEWVDHVLGEQEQGNIHLTEVVHQMSELHRCTMEQINDISGGFSLLLPDDESDLAERTEALAAWCQGFVYGLAAGGITDGSELPEDTTELLSDMIEISRADLEMEAGAPTEEDEQAYAEIVEYVRTGVLLINEELQPLQASQTVH